MGEFIHLVGADDVRSAGNAMCEAARSISSSAQSMAWTFEQIQRALAQHESALCSLSDKIDALIAARKEAT